MRRVLTAALLLLALTRSSAVAQACRGMASFSGGPIQLTGDGSLNAESNAVSAGLGFGLATGPFGQVEVGTRSNDTFGGSSLELGGSAGYELKLGERRPLHVCPIAGLGIGIGPNNAFGSDVERSSRTALFGVAVATTVATGRNWVMLQSLGLAYAYRNDKAQNQAGATLFDISDHYALTQVGLGLVIGSNLTIRPHLDLPIAPDNGDPTIGLTVGYNFGKHAGTGHRGCCR